MRVSREASFFMKQALDLCSPRRSLVGYRQDHHHFSLSKMALAKTAELKGVFKTRGPRL